MMFGAAFGLCHLHAKTTNLFWPSHNTTTTNNNTDHLITNAVPDTTSADNTGQFSTTNALQQRSGFDYFVFVLQWPAAFCNIQRNKTGERKCDPDPPLPKHQIMFTARGLRPPLNDAKSPTFCTTGQQMLDRILDEFRNDLLDYWPHLFSAQNFEQSKKFWQDEWNRYGKCSSNKIGAQQYLRLTIDLPRKYGKPIFDELRRLT